jgi:formamidopyrimidine-DNA glycosylase
MPELPEAETIVRVLRDHLMGQVLPEAGPLTAVSRWGKAVLLHFGTRQLSFRLGMTGTLRLNTQPDSYTRSIYRFGRDTLLYRDIRRFGRATWDQPLPLGPDILAISPDDFGQRLSQRSRAIKPLLLDQSFVSGLGNIYTDELLYRAAVHPLRPASTVPAVSLLAEARALLAEAIAAGGSTISDFFDPLGRPGSFQDAHRVYGKAGQRCPRCGGLLERILVAQRGTHLCPACQHL